MDDMRHRQEQYARAGYITAAIDCRYHGARAQPYTLPPPPLDVAPFFADPQSPAEKEAIRSAEKHCADTWAAVLEEHAHRKGLRKPVGADGRGLSKRDVYQLALVAAWRGSGERPFLLDTAWDLLHVMDVLESREDVDASRMGITGTA